MGIVEACFSRLRYLGSRFQVKALETPFLTRRCRPPSSLASSLPLAVHGARCRQPSMSPALRVPAGGSCFEGLRV